MRKRLAPLLVLALLFAAAPAAAAVLPLAGATLRLEIASLPPVVFAWNGTGSADVAADHISNLSPGVMAFSGTIPVTDPNVFPILGLAITGAENGCSMSRSPSIPARHSWPRSELPALRALAARGCAASA